jgi:uncharacterized protein (TIGR00730 family)
MSQIKNICVYCGSGDGRDPVYRQAAEGFGRILAQSGIGLVYGGGSLGLMGAVATSVLEHGGHVTGIIPQFLTEREKMLRDVQQLIVTNDMHERKRLMFESSDAFVALPGGIGTLEETVEMLTWSQLGRHDKPILLANIDGFWDPLCALFDHMLAQAFIRPDLDIRYLTVDRVEDIIPALREAVARLPEDGVDEAETVKRM